LTDNLHYVRRKRLFRPKFDRCEFCVRSYCIVVDDVTAKESRVYFHDCLLLDNGLECQYPARLCAFAYEQEEFAEAIIMKYLSNA